MRSVRFRRVAIVAILAAVAVVLSGCFEVVGTLPALVSNNGQLYDMGDPAGVQFPKPNQTADELFATNVINPGETDCPATPGTCHVPTWTEYVNSHTYVKNSFTDALPSPPTWDSLNTWAPSVSYYGNEYIMVFSASPRVNSDTHYTGGSTDCSGGDCGSTKNCIGEAYLPATTPNSFFSANNTLEWCADDEPANCTNLISESDTTGFLDPTIVIDNNKNAWLVWSIETGSGGNGDSEIVSAELSYNGQAWQSSTECPTVLMQYNLAANAIAYDYGSGANLGSNSYVENPAVVVSAYDGFDVMASVGSFATNNYYTVWEPCSQINLKTSCGTPAAVNAEGGMSIVNSGSTEYGIWGYSYPNRADWALQVSY